MHDHPDLVIDCMYVCSGWPEVLPQQAMGLHMLVMTATDNDIDGSLDELASSLGDVWFNHFTGGLDCDIRWTHPLELDDPLEFDLGEAARREFLPAFSLAGMVLPTSVRDLAESMAELGIFEVSEGGRRWRAVEWPPAPEEVLALSAEFQNEQNRRRWLLVNRPYARQLVDLLPAGASVTTSVEELARVLDLPETAVRGGLELLVDERAVTLPIDPERVALAERFDVTLDFDPFVRGDVE